MVIPVTDLRTNFCAHSLRLVMPASSAKAVVTKDASRKLARSVETSNGLAFVPRRWSPSQPRGHPCNEELLM